jgi:hypothetical protein
MADADHIGAMKRCTACNEAKPATVGFFPPHNPGKYAVHSLCIPCKKADDARRRGRPDQKARQKAWRDANKERVREYNLAYRAAGYKSTEHGAEWRAKNLERARAHDREYEKRRRATDPAYKLKCRLSARLNAMLNGKKCAPSEVLLGYTRHELIAHLERQFTRGMSWDAFGRGEIEVDHIIPVRSFKISNVDDPDFKACWGLPNLRPLWKKQNRSKGGKVLTLL